MKKASQYHREYIELGCLFSEQVPIDVTPCFYFKTPGLVDRLASLYLRSATGTVRGTMLPIPHNKGWKYV